MSFSRLLWLRIATEYNGVSSQTGSTMTTKKGVVVSVDEARACSIAFLMSPGSYSGLAVSEGAVECPEGGVLWVCGAIGNARLHGVIEGSRKYFRPRLECELDGPL